MLHVKKSVSSTSRKMFDSSIAEVISCRLRLWYGVADRSSAFVLSACVCTLSSQRDRMSKVCFGKLLETQSVGIFSKGGL